MSNKKKPRASKNSPHEPKTTTLSRSWLNGWTDNRVLHEPVVLARVYFTGWTEKKVRTLCRELLAVLNRHTMPKKLSPLGVLTNAIAVMPEAFWAKWIDQLTLIDTGNARGRADSKTYAHSRLIAALMLKAAADGDIATAVDAERFLSHHGSKASALDVAKPDIERGRKWTASMMKAHEKRHGNANQKAERRRIYQADVNRLRLEYPAYSRNKVCEIVANERGVNTRTVANNTKKW
jgi:hypothetical protein